MRCSKIVSFCLIIGLVMIAAQMPLFGQSPVILRPLETIETYPSNTEARQNVPVIGCIDLDPSGQFLAFGGDDYRVRVLCIPTRQRLDLPRRFDSWIRGVTFCPDKRKLAAIAQNGSVQVWSVSAISPQTGLPTLRELFSFRVGPLGIQRGAHSVAFSPDGSLLAVAGFDSTVVIVNATNGRLVRTLQAPSTGSRTVMFSPDGSRLAVAGLYDTVRIWNVTDGSIAFDMVTDNRRVNALAFNQDGSLLAVGGESPFVSVWNLANGRNVLTFPERPGKTFSLAFCGNNLLASGESDNAIRLWRLDRQEQVATLLGHTGTVGTLAYDAATNRLVSGSFDTTIRIWALP